ncbi:MAG: GtrA family protein [Oscillospiraceae bacterium]|nr:GtrA family protein [Oscillospiraceae bacterium]MCI8761707.1 GtrA family protein [Oscillospiraceae bacterium]MCI8807525.1 GtrA family protein [Oscillospiraceae bacterium]MCI9308866.1 GtrA family protein [Oscillospiraceae bacterium]MCI9548871.1 GtrA family protein [Oscillospiraceae bacterium]
MTDTLRTLLQKHREIVSYIFWGVMTTAVNYAAYFLLRNVFLVPLVAGNAAAWAVSVLFAYFVNKLFVFRSKDWAWRVALRELWQMVASRIFSLGLETGILWLFVEKLLLNEFIVKLAANVLVVIVNYVLSKFIIFNKKTG